MRETSVFWATFLFGVFVGLVVASAGWLIVISSDVRLFQ